MMENRKICPRPRLSNRRRNLHNPLYKDFIWYQLRVHSPHIHIHSLYAVYSAIQFPFLPRDATRYATAVYAVVVCLSVCLSLRHKPVLHRNDRTNWVVLGHGGFLPPVPYCVARISKNYSTSLCDFVPNSGLREYRHRNSISLSTKPVIVDVDGLACWRHLYDNRWVVAVY